jgi:hypothetical protein
VVELDDERHLVGVAAGDRAEDADGRGDGVAAALQRELHDVARIEVLGIRGERGAGGVLDALVDGEDRDVARAGQAARARHEPLQVLEHLGRAIGVQPDAVEEVRAGKVEARGGDPAGLVLEQLAASSPRSSSRRVLVISAVVMGGRYPAPAAGRVGDGPRVHGAELHHRASRRSS